MVPLEARYRSSKRRPQYTAGAFGRAPSMARVSQTGSSNRRGAPLRVHGPVLHAAAAAHEQGPTDPPSVARVRASQIAAGVEPEAGTSVSPTGPGSPDFLVTLNLS
ncbi:hypothetical protein NDU88_002262 [Pleurodeles waltl]|uniref:Uncharacterized protein n=1 Tax=Pleurodeles waltl TaxID=8319 RepID=A0AAV7P6E7_PLEWA|nr:hypothetical protein NDU88_002262 [Pleurodeles waltl]